jgi:hypothetical protein
MFAFVIVITIGFPGAVSGTVPSGATQERISVRIGSARVASSGVTRAGESSTNAVITVPLGNESAL